MRELERLVGITPEAVIAHVRESTSRPHEWLIKTDGQ